MKIKHIFLLLLVLFFPTILLAQKEQAIAIGQKCPDAILKMYNYKNSTAKLSDFKKDLLIIDFWATWCGGCIKSLPKYEALQKQFKDKLVILPVTSQNLTKIEKFWPENMHTRSLTLPSVIGDSVLNKIFPHLFVPYEVWINRSGIVIAITGTDLVTRENIQKALNEQKLSLPTLKYVKYDYSIPLFRLDNSFVNAVSTSYHSGLTGYLEGEQDDQPRLLLDTIGSSVRAYVINNFITELYKLTIKGTGLETANSRFVVETKDSVRFFPEHKKTIRQEWNEKNAYCYESIVPLGTTYKDIQNNMRLDLNRYLKLNGRIEHRKIGCWVLKDLQVKNTEKSTSNYSIKGLVTQLNNLKGLPPIINESSLDINTLVSPKVSDLLQTNQAKIQNINDVIRINGLKLVPKVRDVEMFILTGQ
jgi:thiol-disulfide isomerase/thioredoxin